MCAVRIQKKEKNESNIKKNSNVIFVLFWGAQSRVQAGQGACQGSISELFFGFRGSITRKRLELAKLSIE